jgi:hypothetical protein
MKNYRTQLQKELLYLEYKKEALNYLLKHNATSPDSEPTTLPDIHSSVFREAFNSGKNIADLIKEIEENFNLYGW